MVKKQLIISGLLLLSLCSIRAENNLIRLGLSTKSPKVDGKVIPGEYGQGIQLDACMLKTMHFRDVNPTPSIKIARDNENLYFCWVSPLRDGEYPESNNFVRDSRMICTDPCVELFLTPPVEPGTNVSYYHFIANVRGAWFDAHCIPEIGQVIPEWNGKYTVANSVADNRWVCEVSLPLSELKLKKDSQDGLLKLQIEMGRDGGSNPQSYTKAFHGYKKHTQLIFDNSAPGIRVTNFGQFSKHQFDPKITLLGKTDLALKADFAVKEAKTVGNPKKRRYAPGKVLDKKIATAELSKNKKAELGANINLPKKMTTGYAAISLVDDQGKIFFRRNWRFNTAPKKFLPPVTSENKPFKLTAFWAPNFGRTHVLADIYNLKRGNQLTLVDVEVFGPKKQLLGKAQISRFQFGGGAVDIDLGKPLEAGNYTVKARVSTPEGKILAEESVNYERKVYPWENSKLGYSDQPIRPWTPIQVKDKDISVWGRTYTMGPMGLPSAIQSLQPEPTRGHRELNLLAGPVTLKAKVDGKELKFNTGESKLISASSTQVILTAGAGNGNLRYAMTGTMDYDGFYRIDMSLTPTQPTLLDQVYIEVPLPTSVARLLFAVGENKRKNNSSIQLPNREGILWDSKSTARNGLIKNDFLPYVWFGDEDRGIAWMADNTAGWILDSNNSCLEVVRKGQVTSLRINLQNRPDVLLRPITASFSLQATPVRPRPAGGSWRKCSNFCWDFFGKGRKRFGPPGSFPLEKEKPAIIDLAKVRTNIRLFPYQNFNVGERRRPVGKEFKGEWMNLPRYGGITHVKSYTDWALNCYQWWLNEAYCAGLYFDCVYPTPNMNRINGVGWTDHHGKVHPGYALFQDREFFKRVATWLRTLPQCHNEEIIIYMHTTAYANVSILGWSGYWLDGESQGRLLHGISNPDAVDRWGYPEGLAIIRTTAIGNQYGIIPSWCTGYPEMGTIFGLHDVPHRLQVKPYSNLPKGEDVKFIDMYSSKLKFIPYWYSAKWYEVKAGGDILCSAWKLGNKIRIQVSNLNNKPAKADLKLLLKNLGVSPNCKINREVDNKVIEHQEGEIKSLPIERHKFVVLNISG